MIKFYVAFTYNGERISDYYNDRRDAETRLHYYEHLDAFCSTTGTCETGTYKIVAVDFSKNESAW